MAERSPGSTSTLPRVGRPGDRTCGQDAVTIVSLVFETATGLKRIATSRIEQDHALPAQSFDVLIRLARSPGRRLRMSDLAAQTSLTPSGLTRAIDRLEDAGLVLRQACAEDRRGSFAQLTAHGIERMGTVERCHRDQLDAMLASTLSSDERDQLVSLLRRLRDHVNPGAAAVSEH